MSDRVTLAREAMRSALQLRRALSIAREEAVNVFDVVSALGVEVQFMDLPSLEGMFCRDPSPLIILPSTLHRPRGRIAFTCAHELGHFQLGHGTRVDEYVADKPDAQPANDEELAANVFASSFLMPRQAVIDRFRAHAWELNSATSLQLYLVACELGVGYETLIKHLRFGLDLVDDDWLQHRVRTHPKEIRKDLVGDDSAPAVIAVDAAWPDVPIDLEIDDVVALPPDAVPSGHHLCEKPGRRERHLFVARQSGTFPAAIAIGNRHLTVRIARRGFCGRLRYRYVGEPEPE